MKRFSDKWIQSIKTTSKKQEFNAGDGFLLRVGVSGSKTFYYRYKQDGKKKLIKLGTYPDCRLEIAKQKHLNAWTAFKNGDDPQGKLSDIKTIGELANNWYEKYISVNRKQPKQIKQIIDANIIPALGKIKLNDVTTRKLVLALEKIVERGANTQANKALSALKQMYNYGISKGIVTINPLQNTKAMDIGGKETPRERTLSMEELKTVWLYLDSKKHRMRKYTVLAIKLLILSGCRMSEIREALWIEFDIKSKLWTIPKERYKTGIEHKVHLTDMMIEMLAELKKLACKSPFILPSTDEPIEKPLSEKALGRAILRSLKPNKNGDVRLDLEHFTLHDFRRTFGSRLSDTLEIDVMVIEKLLGHKLPKIMATYQKDEMLPKREKALEQWSEKIAMLISNSNVVVLQKVNK